MKLEPGPHSAIVTDTQTANGPVKVQFGEAGTGTKQCAVNFEVVGDSPFAGQAIMWFGYLTNDAAKRTCEALRLMGLKGDDITKANEQAMDQVVTIIVEESEYNGKTSLKVAWVNRHGGGQGFELKKPLAQKDMAKFAATMKSYLSKTPEVAGEKADSLKSEPNGASPPGGEQAAKEREDDLSF